MNDLAQGVGPEGSPPVHPLRFEGEWREFLPIALTNLALTIVTLGIYRFWAKARERRYLWSRTFFIDDTFEWTGTGKEMLIGFLIVTVVLLPFLLFFNIGLEALLLRGRYGLAAGVAVSLYAGIFYLYHVARFRALRYQLSRSWWHGIRGGSDDSGWRYGLGAAWRFALGTLALGLLIPWSLTSTWNMRWSRMHFGSYDFRADADVSGLMSRWMLLYLTPIIGAIVVMGVGLASLGAGFAAGGDQGAAMAGAVGIVVGVLLVYLIFLLLSLSFYALFYRRVAAATDLGGLRLEFTARTRDWLKLILGNIGLVIVTLGVGLIFLGYRNWSFKVRHLKVIGALDPATLAQAASHAPGEAEGLADAFDFGSI